MNGPDAQPPPLTEAPPAPAVRRVGLAAPRLTVALLALWAAFNWDGIVSDPSSAVVPILVVITALIAVTIHESAHYAVGTLLGLRDLVIRVSPIFGYVGPADRETDIMRMLTPAGRIAFAGAGPAANLLTYVLLDALVMPNLSEGGFAHWVVGTARGVMLWSLILGVINLLPISILDGGRIVQGAIATLAPTSRPAAMRAYRAFTTAVCAMWLIGALASGEHWGWRLTAAVQICALGLLGFLVDLPEEDSSAEGTGGASGAPASPMWARPLLAVAIGVGLGVGHLLGVVLYR